MRRDRADESAAARARWLAELAEALLRAQDLSWRFGQAVGQSPEAMDLYARLESVRGEVRSLQLRPVPGGGAETDPEWMNKSPWCSPWNEGGDQTP